MEYSFQDFRTEYSPVMGLYPQNNQNMFNGQMFYGFPYNYPNQFGQPLDGFPTNMFMFDNPNNFSRQTTMLKSRMSTPMNSQQFFTGFMPLPGSNGPAFFRRRNSTNLLRNKTRSRSFRRSASNSTNNTKMLVSRVSMNNFYPQHTSNSIQHSFDGKQMFPSPFSNMSTNLSRNNTQDQQGSEQSNYDSSRSKIKLRPRKSKRNPNFDKTSPFNRAFNSLKDDFALPKLDTKDAMEFFEGLVVAVFNVLRSLVGELRADIIMGMFKPDDPDYDAARSYYYSNLNEKVPSSGLTQRIDYTEAIENEYKKLKVVEAVKMPIENVPEYVNMGSKDFMNMSEREFEEFLLRESYPEVPLSVPRL